MRLTTALVTLCLASSPAWAQDPSVVEAPLAEVLPIITAPSVLQYVEAPYPAQAEADGIEGTVTLLIELDETGALTHTEVVGPAGNGFDEAALEAVRQMRFTPARTADGPVPVALEFDYGFTLDEAEPEPNAPPALLPINLIGEVVEMGTRRPVEGAFVSVDGTELTTRTDADGRFELRGVPVGDTLVRVLHPGHVTVDSSIEIFEGEQSEFRFWMRAEAYRNNEVVAVYQKEREEITRRTITMDEARRIPGTFGDPIKVIQTLPGAARSPFGTGLLVIRGSNPEDSAVYVDGVRIPIIYHLTGTTSVLSPDLIQSVDYLPGNYGVQYGRSSGGVVDVKTKDEFEDSRLVWGTDILDSQLYWEGNVGKGENTHGLSLAARRSYIDAFLPLVTGDTGFTIKPRYWDYSAKWVPPTQDENEFFSLFVYGFNDLISLATPDDVAQGSDQDTQGDFRTEYQSHRIIAHYRRALSERWSLDVTPSIGIDTTSFALGQGFQISNTNGLAQVRAELPYVHNPKLTITPGIDLIGGPWQFRFASPFGIADLDDPLGERDPVAFDGHGTAWTVDSYVKAQWRPLDQADKWLLTGGLRANTLLYTYGGSIAEGAGKPYSRVSFDPRFATRFTAFDGGTLKAATGIFHQPAQPFESVGLGTDVDLAFERSWSTTLGFEHQLSQAISWDVDVFYKDLSQLVVQSPDFVGNGSAAFVNSGQGRAYGAEFIIRHAPVNRFFGWVSYTLSHSERQDRPEQEAYLFDFDQTHIFSAQAGYDLPRDFSVSAQVQFVTGNPTRPFDTGVYDVDGNFYNPLALGPYNSDRLPPFFQTSFRLDKLWTFRRWQLNTYVDLINAVRGVNPEFTIYNADYTESAYVRGLPFIPNIGFEVRLYP